MDAASTTIAAGCAGELVAAQVTKATCPSLCSSIIVPRCQICLAEVRWLLVRPGRESYIKRRTKLRLQAAMPAASYSAEMSGAPR